jgi:hypothetical protein
VKNYGVTGDRTKQTEAALLTAWPILKNPPQDTILISRKIYLPLLGRLLNNYKVVEAKSGLMNNSNVTVAFIPKSGR